MGKIAFVFAGQGAQASGMGKELYEASSAAKGVFDMAGQDVLKMCFEGSQESLNQTINTQPCLFATDLACARALNERGIFAQGVAGFSLGEIPAVAYVGMMSDEKAFDLVTLRAKAMDECAREHEGVMYAALKLSSEQVEEICSGIDGAFAVNYNCPGQTVVACSASCAESFEKSAAAAGARCMKLAVSGAFHSPFMEKASVKLGEFLENVEIKTPQVDIYSNVTGKIYENPREQLKLQVKSPVLWQKTIENMINDGFDIFIEVGQGKTLSGLIKKISSDVKVLNVCDVESLEKTVAEAMNA